MDPNDTDAFAAFIQSRLTELGPAYMAQFIMEHAWEQASEEFNNEWINHCEEEEEA